MKITVKESAQKVSVLDARVKNPTFVNTAFSIIKEKSDMLARLKDM